MTIDEESRTTVLRRPARYQPPRSWRTWLLGRPLPTADAEDETINKKVGLAIFASDALSSTAYATQEILVEMADTREMQERFDALLKKHRGQVTESSLTREEGYLRMEITAKLEPPISHDEALEFMKENDGVRRISV